jgi:hypothetical protein
MWQSKILRIQMSNNTVLVWALTSAMCRYVAKDRAEICSGVLTQCKECVKDASLFGVLNVGIFRTWHTRNLQFEEQAKIKFCVKLGIPFSQTYNITTEAYPCVGLQCTTVYKWFTYFKEGQQSWSITHRKASSSL